MVKMKNLLCCDVTRGCHRGPQKFLEIVSSTIFILWSLLPHTAVGFGQGTMIENSFESTYCRNGVSVLSRGPVHYDLRRCGGQCSSSRAPRDMYRMVVNSTTYSVDNVQVQIRANPRRGANLLGFAVVAITEDGGTAGRWVVDEDAPEPEVLRATCDSLLEGQVIFQAQPSNERTNITVVWNPRKTNYGSVIFRAWIVQSMDAIFVVDSHPLTNPLDGREFMEIENHFRDLLDVMTSEPTPRRDSSPSRHSPNVSRRTVGLSGSRRKPPRSRNSASRANRIEKNNDMSRENRTSRARNSQSQIEEKVNSNKFTMEHFEDAFLARMTSGFDLSMPDPFSEFNDGTLQLSDLVPDHTAHHPSRELNLSSGPLPENRTSNTNTSRSSLGNDTLRGNIPQQNSGPFDQRIPQQFPRGGEIRPQPGMANAGLTQRTLPGMPTGFFPSQFRVQQTNMLNIFRPSPGNPFSQFQMIPVQNQFPTTLSSPLGNSVPQGFQNQAMPHQPLPGASQNFGSNNNRNIAFGSNILPGFNSLFSPQRSFQPSFNQWAPNWNSGANWRFQNGGGRGINPGWNSDQNLAGWNRNIVGSASNQLRSNFNMGPNPSFPDINVNTNPRGALSLNRFDQARLRPNSNGENSNIESSQPLGNTNTNTADISAERTASPDGLGSFSELLHAAGGWGRK